MTHATCRLTAENRDQLRNPTLGNGVWATSTFLVSCIAATVFNKLTYLLTFLSGNYALPITSYHYYYYYYCLEHSNSGKKVSIRFSLPNRFFRFDSIRQSDKFAASTLIFK